MSTIWQEGDSLTPTNLNSKGPQGVFAVTAYGAAGDGSTDDTAALQAAINAAQLVGGGVVYLSDGTYQVSGVTISKPGVQLVGSGPNSAFLRNISNNTVLYISNASGDMFLTRLEDFRITNTNASTFTKADGIGVTGLQTNQNDLYIWRNVYIDNMRVGSDISGRFLACSLEDVSIVGGSSDGMRFHGFGEQNTVTFRHLHLHGNSGSGLYISNDYSGVQQQAFSFYGCTIESCGSNAVQIGGTTGAGIQSFLFSGCLFDTNASSITSGSASPTKSHFHIAPPGGVLGFAINDCTFFGAPDVEYAVWMGPTAGTLNFWSLTGNRIQQVTDGISAVSSNCSLFMGRNNFEPSTWTALTVSGTTFSRGDAAVIPAVALLSGTTALPGLTFVSEQTLGLSRYAAGIVSNSGKLLTDKVAITNGTLVRAGGDNADPGPMMLNVVGRSDATTNIVARFSSQSTGSGSYIQFTDNGNYNVGIGIEDTSGDVGIRDGHIPNTAGTLRAKFLRASGAWQLSDGSSTTPAFSFLSETSLGFRRSASSTIALSYGALDVRSGALSVRSTNASATSATLNDGEFRIAAVSATSAELAYRSGNTTYRFIADATAL